MQLNQREEVISGKDTTEEHRTKTQLARSLVSNLTRSFTALHEPVIDVKFQMTLLGQKGKGTVAIAKKISKIQNDDFRLVYYPAEQDVELFAKSAETLKTAGPSEYFPGSVGSAACSIISGQKTGLISGSYNAWIIHNYARILVDYVQGHFRIGTPSELDAKKARIYGGWRRRLFDGILKLQRKMGLIL